MPVPVRAPARPAARSCTGDLWPLAVQALVQALAKIECPPPSATFTDYSHITSQIGMFAFTGLTAPQVRSMRAVEHVYCTENGRMSLAGLAAADVPYVAAAVKRATDAIPYEARVAVAA